MKSWVTKSNQKIYQVLGRRCNCFLISYENKYLLVDTGRENRWKDLRKELDKLGVSNHSLRALILTHSHFDHAENAANIKENFRTVIILHKTEGEFLKTGDNPVIRGTTVVTRFITDILASMHGIQYFRYRPVNYDILIEERYDLNDLGFNGYLLHTPGHTAGSISVILDDEIAIVGDAMFGVFRGSVFPPYAEDPTRMVKSWEKLLNTACSVYLPAHGFGRNRALLLQQYDKYKKVYNL